MYTITIHQLASMLRINVQINLNVIDFIDLITIEIKQKKIVFPNISTEH